MTQQNEGAQPGIQQQASKAETGSARPEYDQYEINQSGNLNKQAEAQQGYGNARNAEGTMEQDVAESAQQDASLDSDAAAQPGELSSRPDERAAADADRPLSGD